MTRQTLRLSIRELGRRSRLEAYVDVLSVMAEGAEKPTHIMYKANLSWTALLAYLKALTQRGLIVERESGSRRVYLLTREGFQALGQFLKLKEALRLKGIPA